MEELVSKITLEEDSREKERLVLRRILSRGRADAATIAIGLGMPQEEAQRLLMSLESRGSIRVLTEKEEGEGYDPSFPTYTSIC